MESCTICCFQYSDQECDKGISRNCKTLSCNHHLCFSCYLKLEKTFCPFCRSTFNYTNEEVSQRNVLFNNITYKNWQPPSQLLNYIPTSNYQVRNRHRSILEYDNIIIPTNNRNQNIEQEPYSRIRKNMVRNRRRNLSYDEVLERRKIIKARSKRKWMKKNNRLDKENFTSDVF